MNTFDQELKDHWIEVMQEHQDADRLIQGDWLDQSSAKVVDNVEIFKGCFFGCAMQASSDALFKATQAMNLPSWLVYFAEHIFEELPTNLAVNFPVELLKSIPVNSNIDKVLNLINIARLETLKHKEHPEVNLVINKAIDYLKDSTKNSLKIVINEINEFENEIQNKLFRAIIYSVNLSQNSKAAAATADWKSDNSDKHAAFCLNARYLAREQSYIAEKNNLINALTNFS